MTVNRDYRLEVSPRIAKEFENGRQYYAMHGQTVHLPAQPAYHPAAEALEFHNEHVFRG